MDDIKKIKELHADIAELRAFANGGAKRVATQDMFKVSTGFNRDNRHKMCGEKIIWYDAHIEYYGNSDASPQITLHDSSRNVFWDAFIEYLNDHEDEVLNAVCDKMLVALSKKKKIIQSRISSFQQVLNDLPTN